MFTNTWRAALYAFGNFSLYEWISSNAQKGTDCILKKHREQAHCRVGIGLKIKTKIKKCLPDDC